MRAICSIDPAVVTLAWVGWYDGSLINAGLSRRSRPASLHVVCMEHADRVRAGLNIQRDVVDVVVEQMRMNKHQDWDRAPGPRRDIDARVAKLIALANDLLDVQAVGARVAACVGSRLHYAPVNTWKGSAPKHVTEARAREKLTPTELATVESVLRCVPSGLAHNLWDAVGVGLWATGRYVLPGRGPGQLCA